MNASSPDDVKMPWLATLSLFSLWVLLFYVASEETGGVSKSPDSGHSNSATDDCTGTSVCEEVNGSGNSIIASDEKRPLRIRYDTGYWFSVP